MGGSQQLYPLWITLCGWRQTVISPVNGSVWMEASSYIPCGWLSVGGSIWTKYEISTGRPAETKDAYNIESHRLLPSIGDAFPQTPAFLRYIIYHIPFMYLSHRPGKSRYIFYAKIVSQPNLLSGAIWDRIIMGIRANVSIKHGTYCLM